MCINDTQGHLLGEYQADDKPVQETIWLGDTPVAVVSTTGASANIRYIWADHLGTPRQITDPASKQILWRWDGEPFGNSLADEDPSKTGKTFSYNLRFPGQYFDKETGKHYNYFRDYDPATGRYIESDPIGLAGGINTYGYVKANPLRFTDPQGLFVPLIIPGVCAAGGCEAAGVVLVAAAAWWKAQPPVAMPFSTDKFGNFIFAKPKPGSKPKGCPSGTKPIDQVPGLDKDDVHGIKDGVGAGPRDWTGITPNGHVITGDSNGDAVDHGPYDVYLP